MEEVQVAPILPLLLRYLDFNPRILLVMELDFKVLKQVQFEYLISALQLFMYS